MSRSKLNILVSSYVEKLMSTSQNRQAEPLLPVMNTALSRAGRAVDEGPELLAEYMQKVRPSSASSTAGRQNAHRLSTSTVAPSQATRVGAVLRCDAKIFFIAPPIKTVSTNR